SDSGSEQRLDIAGSSLESPQFRIDLYQGISRDNSHRNLVRQRFCLEIWMVSVNPNMSQFMRKRSGQGVFIEFAQQLRIGGNYEHTRTVCRRLGRKAESVVVDDLNFNKVRDAELFFQRLHDKNDSL